jgi:AcrR family transcriptional regulator
MVEVQAEPRRRVRMSRSGRRRQILDETASVLAHGSYAGLRLQDVADRCGITVAGVLHYVGSKEGLLLAVLEDRDAKDEAEARELLASLDPGAPPSLAAVRETLRAVVVRNVRQPEILRLFTLLSAESMSAGHPAAAFFTARQERGVRELAAILEGHADDPAALARLLLAAMYGLEVAWLREDKAFDMVQAWDRMAERLLPAPQDDSTPRRDGRQ